MENDVTIYQISKKELRKIKSMRKIESWAKNNRCITFIAADNKAYKCDRADFIGLQAVQRFKKEKIKILNSQTSLI